MDEITRWVRQQLDQGVSPEQVWKNLRQEGYSDDAIEEVLEETMHDTLQTGESSLRSRTDNGLSSWIKGVFVDVVQHPTLFFQSLDEREKGFKRPVFYSSLMVFISVTMIMMLGVLEQPERFPSLLPDSMGTAAVVGASLLAIISVIVPVTIVVALFFVLFCFLIARAWHTIAKHLGGTGSGRETFAALVYASSTITTILTVVVTLLATGQMLLGRFTVFHILTQLCMLALTLYFLYIQIRGFSTVENISTRKAAAIILLPAAPLALLILGFG